MPASIRKASQMKSFGWILTMLSMASSACFAFPSANLRKVHPTFALYSYDPEQESKLDVTFNRAKLEEKFMTTKDEDEKMRLLQEHYDSMIPVRFINYDQIGGSTKLAYAVPGTNILKIADELGIRIPRQCRTGLCGSCTCDVKDPTWEAEEGERVGYQTVRTCRSGAMLPAGCDEMIIDCYRMVESAKMDEYGNVIQGNPLDFGDGWEELYVPNYKGTGSVVVKKKMKPEWTVKGGRMQSVDIRLPGFKPRLDDGVAPWDQIY